MKIFSISDTYHIHCSTHCKATYFHLLALELITKSKRNLAQPRSFLAKHRARRRSIDRFPQPAEPSLQGSLGELSSKGFQPSLNVLPLSSQSSVDDGVVSVRGDSPRPALSRRRSMTDQSVTAVCARSA